MNTRRTRISDENSERKPIVRIRTTSLRLRVRESSEITSDDAEKSSLRPLFRVCARLLGSRRFISNVNAFSHDHLSVSTVNRSINNDYNMK